MKLDEIANYVPENAPEYVKKDKLLLVDRDGVLNRDTHFPHGEEGVEVIAEVGRNLGVLRQMGWNIVMISNQGGIGDGRYPEEDFFSFNRVLLEQLAEDGGYIDRIYYCPHSEHQHDCICRKPKPGMVMKALKDFEVKPDRAVLLGDRLSDMQAARMAGVKSYLLLTGFYKEGEPHLNYEIRKDMTEVLADLAAWDAR